MTLEIKHATQVDTEIYPDDGTSPVGSNEWNAELIATMATARMLGRRTDDNGDVEELTAEQVIEFLTLASVALSGSYGDLADLPSLGSSAEMDAGAAAGNVPVLDGDGKLATSVLPALALTDVFEVASQSAMLALTAQQGDVAIRTDLNKTFVLSTGSPSTLANWKELRTPTDVVLSVAGLTGTITGSALKTALAIALADITDMSANGRSLVAMTYANMFAEIKQAASETSTGVVELATEAEMDAGTDASRVPSVKVIADYIAANAGGGAVELIDEQIFTTSGTWTKPVGVEDTDLIEIDVWGGGGSGGKSTSGTIPGGGGGGHNNKRIRAGDISASETIVVGAGGAAVSGGGSVLGNTGGMSGFGSIVLAYGGGGAGGTSAPTIGGGGGGILGPGGTSAANGVNARGGAPQGASNDGTTYLTPGDFGGGLGSGASGGPYDNFSAAIHGGAGANTSTDIGSRSSVFGGGAGGSGIAAGAPRSTGGISQFGGAGGDGASNSPASDGQIPGGGGGGCASSTAGHSSGAGARGEVRVRIWRGI